MASFASWFSPAITHALGWALIHSLWQCVGLAALAAVLMAFSRRPSVRYLVATTALIAMLAAPTATFFLLMKPSVLVQPAARAPLPALGPSNTMTIAIGAPAPTPATGAANNATNSAVAIVLADSPKPLLPPRLISLNLSPNILPPGALPWLVAAWLSGVALFSGRFLGGFLLLEYRRRRQSALPSPRILAIAHGLQRKLGLARTIRYLECGWLQTPAVIGWLRPIVFLPVAALTGLSEAQLKAVIAHELAHIRRFDSLVNLLQILVETLLFYHPAIWWLNKRMRAERELCCDEIAVSLTGDRKEYAKTLTLMAEWEKAPLLAMAANRGSLTERIFHILGRRTFGLGQRMLGLTGSILFLAAALGAANALFGIAYPIPTAHAKATLRESLEESAPTPRRAPIEITAQAGTFLAPKPALSRLLVTEPPIAPQEIASNSPPTSQPGSNPAQAVAFNDQSAPPAMAQTATSTCASPTLVNSLPMAETPDSDTMTVDATIDGKPERLLVGIADITTLWSGEAGALKLPVREGRRSMDAGGRFSEDVARIESFQLGSMQTGNFDLQISPDPDFANAGSGGILGTDMMQLYDIDLDFAHRLLNYFSPEQCQGAGVYWAPRKLTAVAMEAYANHVYVPVTLDGKAITAVLDTTSDKTFLNPEVARELFGLKTDALEPGAARNGGALIKAGMHRFSNLGFAGLTFANPEIAIPFDTLSQSTREFNARRTDVNRYTLSQLLPDMTIGMDVLRKTHLYVSFKNQRIYVSPAGDGQALKPGPIATSWFNIWRYGYDTYLHPYRRPFVKF